MTERPILFLDIDGVVNAFPKKHKKNYAEYVRYDVPVHDDGVVTVFPIHVRPQVIDFINRVHREGLAQVRWLTTWGRFARTDFAPAVGLDDFPVAAEPAPLGSKGRKVWLPTWWKLAVIREQAAGRRFVFADDDLGQETRAILKALPGESLLITPFQTPGLEDWQLDKIEVFLKG